MTTKTNLHPVDQLGELLAQIANLHSKCEAIKDDLKSKGPGSYEGETFRATVSTSDRVTLDVKACRKKLIELGVSHQWISANSKHTEVATVRCVARKGEKVEA